jgi:hypothetical protein
VRHIGRPPSPVISLPNLAPRVVRVRRPRLDWGALTAGLAVAAALQLALALFGGALGLSGMGAAAAAGGVGERPLWGAVVLAISLYVGGTTTGRIAGARGANRGTLHGVVLWALATLLARWLPAADLLPPAAVAGGGPATLWLALLGLGVGLTAAVGGVRGWLGR